MMSSSQFLLFLSKECTCLALNVKIMYNVKI